MRKGALLVQNMSDKEILERISGLMHQIWWEWSQDLAQKEKISPERLARWNKLWRRYKDLNEKERESARFYGRKITRLLLEIAQHE